MFSQKNCMDMTQYCNVSHSYRTNSSLFCTDCIHNIASDQTKFQKHNLLGQFGNVMIWKICYICHSTSCQCYITYVYNFLELGLVLDQEADLTPLREEEQQVDQGHHPDPAHVLLSNLAQAHRQLMTMLMIVVIQTRCSLFTMFLF